MTRKQKDIMLGMILGDAYLQKTGKQNARLRLEHSILQKEYMDWKIMQFQNYFQSRVQILTRKNPIWEKTYSYVRIQSTASPDFGKLRRLFYSDSNKIIPNTLKKYLNHPLSLAVWYMDDGYYYHRDKIASIYIPNFDKESLLNLMETLKDNFNLHPTVKHKKKGLVLVFSVIETQIFIEIIKRFIIPSMRYKLPLDPVSTDRKSQNATSSEMVE